MLNKPKDSYVGELLSLCNSDAKLIRWYREILADRARLRADYLSNIRLVTRRKGGTAAYKHACDCYLLNAFVNGDNTVDIRELFVPSTANETITIGTPRISEPEPQTVKDKLNVASMMAMIVSLQKELQEIKQKQHENAVLMNDMKNDMRSIYTSESYKLFYYGHAC